MHAQSVHGNEREGENDVMLNYEKVLGNDAIYQSVLIFQFWISYFIPETSQKLKWDTRRNGLGGGGGGGGAGVWIPLPPTPRLTKDNSFWFYVPTVFIGNIFPYPEGVIWIAVLKKPFSSGWIKTSLTFIRPWRILQESPITFSISMIISKYSQVMSGPWLL